MKTILVIGQLPPPLHGSNIMAEITIQTLKKLGYSVSFIDKDLSTDINQIGKVTIRKIFRIPILGMEVLINSLIKKPSMCIFFSAIGKPAFLIDSILLFILRKCKVPYVIRFDGKGYSTLKKEGYFWKKLVNTSLSKALGGIVLGNKLKNDVNSSINDNMLIKVPNCIQEPIHSDFKKKEDGRIRILFLSNLLPSKGVLQVLKAAKIVLKNKDAYFTLAGSFGSLKFENEISDYIDKNKIGKYICLPGTVQGKEKAKLFESSDIFVFPTYYERETFGIVNVEAMSYGLPVVSSSEGAIPEIVLDGINGYIVNPKSPEEIAEKIIILVDNPDLRKRMGDKGKEIYKRNFTLKAHADSLDIALKKFFKFKIDDIKKNRRKMENCTKISSLYYKTLKTYCFRGELFE